MLKKLLLGSDHLVFQSQLIALLKKNVELSQAVGMIESKASTKLRQRIARAGTPVLPGLVREGLITPELAAFLGRPAPANLDQAMYLRRCLDDEIVAGGMDLQIRGQFSRILMLFGVTTVYAMLMQRSFTIFLSPRLREAAAATEFDPSIEELHPRAWIGNLLFSTSLVAMLGFLGTVMIIYLALKFDGNQLRSRFGLLLKIPFIRSLFRKRTTHRMLAHCSSMIAAGAAANFAVETSLSAIGISTPTKGTSLPNAAILDPLTVEAVNLGSELGTFEEQLEATLDYLRNDLPFTARRVSRVIYYAGYVFLGMLVGTLLVQYYQSIFRTTQGLFGE